MSQIRQNYHSECEASINKQINLELYASYVYRSMAWYFDRDDVAMKGLHKYFRENADEENEHAEKLMKYQNTRGGRVVLQKVDKPDKDTWGTPLDAMQAALELEKTVNQSLLDLHKLSASHDDAHLCDYLEREFLDDQVESIKKISEYITNLKRVGNGLGEFLFDKHLQS